MRKKVSIILLIISILIIIFGFLSAKNTKDELVNKAMPSGNIYIDGTDMTAASKAFAQIGSGLLGFAIIIYSFLLVGAIWVVYGIIILVILIIKKINNKNTNKKENF